MSVRTIIVKEGNKLIYEGPEKVPYPAARLPFGMTPGDIVQVITIICACAIFVVTTRQTLQVHSKNIEHLMGCQQAADQWHSAASGTQFNCGGPVSSINTKGIRDIFKGGIDAEAGQ